MKKIFSRLLKTLFILLISIGIYFLCAFILSRISIEKEKANQTGIKVYILSNGVHTDIIVPIKTPQFNWRNFLKPEDTLSKDSTSGFAAFGWGDKGFYLETPTWSDLKFSTAFKAAFGLSNSAIHVTYYKGLKENQNCKSFQLSSEQYLRLVKYIQESFLINENGAMINIQTNAVYGTHDAFYEATGSYSLFKTCNTWTNNALKKCGQKACVWTPFESGIFYHYK